MPTAQFMRTAIAAIVLSLGGFRASAAELVPFQVGMAAPANTFLAIWMAQAAELYAAQGLRVAVVSSRFGHRLHCAPRAAARNITPVIISPIRG
jgi:hypothetical protein